MADAHSVPTGPDPTLMVERALVRIRRDQQAQGLRRVSGRPAGGADAARYRYLDALDDVPEGLAISEIGRAIGVDRPRASRLTSELLDEGLIERRSRPDDARFALVRLTDQGAAIVAAMHESRQRAVATALSGFTAEESRSLGALLERFVDAWPREGRETPR